MQRLVQILQIFAQNWKILQSTEYYFSLIRKKFTELREITKKIKKIEI